jgi:hypothetical protein
MSEREEGAEVMESAETTPAVETTAETATVQMTPASPATSGEDLAKVRDLVLKAHPDVVPDLVRGRSVDDLIASVEPARSAYQRVAEAVRAGSGNAANEPAGTAAATEASAAAQPPAVPAGGAGNVIDPASIPPSEKIARALAERKRRG